jgi:hypothetical protein
LGAGGKIQVDPPCQEELEEVVDALDGSLERPAVLVQFGSFEGLDAANAQRISIVED